MTTEHATPNPYTHIDNARLMDGRIVRLTIDQGTITAIVPMAGLPRDASNDQALDLQQALLLPALIDGHVHLDKTMLGLPWLPHAAGADRTSRIDYDKKILPNLPVSTRERAGNLIQRCVTHGSGFLRSHVDIDTDCRLDRLHGALQAREDHAHRIDIQLVAFPQSGVIRDPGTLDLLDQAIRAGADLVGGMDPCSIDRDPAGQLNGIFDIAQRHSVGIDIHLHETGELGLFSLQEICRRAKALGMRHHVTVSHGFCLGTIPESSALAAAEMMADAGVMLATHGAAKWPLPPLALLRNQGVIVFAGNDGIRDTWTPYGTGDVLERAALIGWRADYRYDEQIGHAFELVTSAAAQALGINDYGIAVGNRADFFSVPAENLQAAVTGFPPRGWVIKAGRVVAHKGQIMP